MLRKYIKSTFPSYLLKILDCGALWQSFSISEKASYRSQNAEGKFQYLLNKFILMSVTNSRHPLFTSFLLNCSRAQVLNYFLKIIPRKISYGHMTLLPRKLYRNSYYWLWSFITKQHLLETTAAQTQSYMLCHPKKMKYYINKLATRVIHKPVKLYNLQKVQVVLPVVLLCFPFTSGPERTCGEHKGEIILQWSIKCSFIPY